ncbi:GNAT family N-acetyltransferase [Prosthecobacter sp.]|uniref:GNAT family N-acetyltransferase n=1 Tax=Prosthecobacter sp. TaxID=1965333 RepID=UPI001DF369A0|nr:GNAT family N-acetyltransferase [Prosthecobacter sp.]MCB1278756.1 GNAT family N-acetyltransferase [Prosthecobacter sp.]
MSESFPRRVWRVARHEGWRSFFVRSVAAFGYRRLILLQRSLNEPFPELRASLPLVIDWLDSEAEADYKELVYGTPDGKVADRLQQGDRCLTARVDGKLAAVMWASTGSARLGFLDLRMPLEPGDVYLNGAFTSPAFRGHSIAPVLSVEMLRRFHESGFQRAVRATVPGNEPALRAHAKAGFAPYAVIGRFKLGSWRRDFCRPWKTAKE